MITGLFIYLYLIFGMCKVSTVITWIILFPNVGSFREADLRFLHTVTQPLSPLSVEKSCKDQSFKCLN